MATANPVSIQPKTSTAEDTLQRKSRDAGVISGGHLVAKALKSERVDTIFTLCGGHVIDIYDGCVAGDQESNYVQVTGGSIE